MTNEPKTPAAQPAGEYPPLPTRRYANPETGDAYEVTAMTFTGDEMRAYADATHAMRAQPAVAPAAPAAVAGPSDAQIIAAFRAYHGWLNEPLTSGSEAARWKRALIAANNAAPAAQAAPVAGNLPAVQDIIDDVLRIKGGAENWEGGWSGTVPVCELVVEKLNAVSAAWANRNKDYEAVVAQCAALATPPAAAGGVTAGAVPDGLTEEAFCDLQFAAQTLAAIAERQRQIGDVIEPVTDIRHASRLASAARARIDRAMSALSPAFDAALAPQPPAAAQEPVAIEGILRKDAAHQLALIARKYGSPAVGREGLMAAMRDAYLLGQQQAAPVAQGDAEDAARYRWLRDESTDLDALAAANWGAGEVYSGAALDAAIDAARAQAQAQQGGE
ncbi:MAG: hypothetical protein J7556_14850 [Acidovorax sp.]|nr:hypothetical protein [Acidovorax sp.]